MSGNLVTYHLITTPFILNIMKGAMKGKTKYLIPAFAAVFALMFVFATPYVQAEDGDYHNKWEGMKHHKMHKVIQIGELSGSEPITEENRDEIKNNVIALSVASVNYPDAKKASLGIAVNDAGEKFLVWNLVSIDKNDDGTVTATIHVVDAIKGYEITTIENSFDHSSMDGKMGKYSMHKFFESLDENTKAQLQAAFEDLKNAKASGDQAQIDAAKQTLRSLFESIKAQN